MNFNDNTKIKINDVIYSIFGVGKYITQNNDDIYYKITLDGEKILVISPADEFAYIGKVENIDCEYNPVSTIQHNNKTFNLVGQDYQILKQIIIGTEDIVEGNIDFIDYMSIDETEIISLAKTEDNKRIDVYAQIINFEEIEII